LPSLQFCWEIADTSAKPSAKDSVADIKPAYSMDKAINSDHKTKICIVIKYCRNQPQCNYSHQKRDFLMQQFEKPAHGSIT